MSTSTLETREQRETPRQAQSSEGERGGAKLSRSALAGLDFEAQTAMLAPPSGPAVQLSPARSGAVQLAPALPNRGGVAAVTKDEALAICSAVAASVIRTHEELGSLSDLDPVSDELRTIVDNLAAAANGDDPNLDALSDEAMDKVLSIITQRIPEILGVDPRVAPYQVSYLNELDDALAADGGASAVVAPTEDQRVDQDGVHAPKVQRPGGHDGQGLADHQSWLVGASQTTKNKIGLFRTRIQSLSAVYRSMMDGDPKKEGAMNAGQQTKVSGRRQAIVAKAMAEIGKTRYGSAGRNAENGAKTDVGPDGGKAFAGWRSVMQYFRGTGANPKLTEKDFAKATHGEHWCGIFAYWAAGYNWGEVLPAKDRLKAAAGDIVQMKQDQHFGIIAWIDPKGGLNAPIVTIEGNQDGGQIVKHAGVLSEWDVAVFDVGD